jgi:hypothetical protein
MNVTLTPRPAYRLTDAEVDWRRSRLSKLGAGDKLAQTIAESGVDVHVIERLVDMGCPLDVAWEITR